MNRLIRPRLPADAAAVRIVSAVLVGLKPEARARVLAWIVERFAADMPGPIELPRATVAPGGGQTADLQGPSSHASDGGCHPATNQREPARRSVLPRDAEGETTALTVADRRAGQINEAS